MAAERWTDRTIKAIKTTGYHKDPESRSRGIDKGALYLQVRKGSSSDGFTHRYQLDHTQRWMGLGAYPGVGLSDAREMARKASAMCVRASILWRSEEPDGPRPDGKE